MLGRHGPKPADTYTQGSEIYSGSLLNISLGENTHEQSQKSQTNKGKRNRLKESIQECVQKQSKIM